MKLLRIGDVIEKTGLSRTIIYLYTRDKQFPQPIKYGKGKYASAWIEEEVDEWIQQQVDAHRRGAKQTSTMKMVGA